MRLVRLISVTPHAESTIAYCARVSSSDQENPNINNLLKYMIREGHWSPFEMANMVVEITTSRAIAQQILRHRSFSFQEFSQRYAEAPGFVVYGARRQDEKNRQNSIDDMSQEDKEWFTAAQMNAGDYALDLYNLALKRGIAKESARFLLPLSTETKLYMNGTLRSWIHYIQLRSLENGTQREHAEIVAEIKKLFIQLFPIISEALEWKNIT